MSLQYARELDCTRSSCRHPRDATPPPQQGWTPTSLTGTDHGAAAALDASRLLLSHRAAEGAHSPSDAAYVFALFGACGAGARLNMLTAIGLLMRTSPIFPVIASLGEQCHALPSLREALAGVGAQVRLQPELQGVRCVGRQYGPDSRPLSGNVSTSFFTPTYSILSAWALTQFRAVLVLDSDLAVRRNLDHVLMAMLARPEIAEARTPEGCLNAISVEPGHGNYFNTGVWGVRPDANLYADLVSFLRAGSVQCGIGIQTAAKAYFRRPRIDNARFEPRAPRRAATQPEGAAARARPWEILQLHAGYNLKANQGPLRCLSSYGFAPNASAYVVHWSGTRKAHVVKPHQTYDEVEQAAHADWMALRCDLHRRYFGGKASVHGTMTEAAEANQVGLAACSSRVSH